MSDEHETGEDTGGRKRIAKSKIEGTVGTLSFADGREIVADVRTLPGAEKINGMTGELLAYGVVSVLQISYNSKSADPYAQALAAWERVQGGLWSPGRPYASGAAKDGDSDLILALAQYRKTSPDEITREGGFLAQYLAKSHFKTMAAVKRHLTMDPRVAAIVADLRAARAKELAGKAKRGGYSADLDMDMAQ